MRPRSATVYIDGFNLYRQALVGTSVKWLDLMKLSQLLLPEYEISTVHYFTARIKHQPHNPHAPNRQQTYLRALGTFPQIEIHFGHFRIDQRDMAIHPLRLDDQGRPVTVRVRKMEEKGSDVNLASQLLLDGFRDKSDAYVVLTNDSDLSSPMRVMSVELGKTIGLISPTQNASADLMSAKPLIHRTLRSGALSASQLPDVLRDDDGVIRRPKNW